MRGLVLYSELINTKNYNRGHHGNLEAPEEFQLLHNQGCNQVEFTKSSGKMSQGAGGVKLCGELGNSLSAVALSVLQEEVLDGTPRGHLDFLSAAAEATN